MSLDDLTQVSGLFLLKLETCAMSMPKRTPAMEWKGFVLLMVRFIFNIMETKYAYMNNRQSISVLDRMDPLLSPSVKPNLKLVKSPRAVPQRLSVHDLAREE